MTVFYEEGNIVDPEENQPGTLQSQETGERSCFISYAIADCNCEDDANCNDHGDKWQDELACTITFVVLIRLVVARTRIKALPFTEKVAW